MSSSSAIGPRARAPTSSVALAALVVVAAAATLLAAGAQGSEELGQVEEVVVEPRVAHLDHDDPGVQLTAVAVFDSGLSEEVTSRATWTSSRKEVASVQAGFVSPGDEQGWARVTAGWSGVTSPEAAISVGPAR